MQSMTLAWLSDIMMHRHCSEHCCEASGEQAVLYGCSLLHTVGPEAPLQAGALPASVVWMMAVVDA